MLQHLTRSKPASAGSIWPGNTHTTLINLNRPAGIGSVVEFAQLL